MRTQPSLALWEKVAPEFKVFHGALIEGILAHGVRHQIEGGPLVQAVDVEKRSERHLHNLCRGER